MDTTRMDLLTACSKANQIWLGRGGPAMIPFAAALRMVGANNATTTRLIPESDGSVSPSDRIFIIWESPEAPKPEFRARVKQLGDKVVGFAASPKVIAELVPSLDPRAWIPPTLSLSSVWHGLVSTTFEGEVLTLLEHAQLGGRWSARRLAAWSTYGTPEELLVPAAALAHGSDAIINHLVHDLSRPDSLIARPELCAATIAHLATTTKHVHPGMLRRLGREITVPIESVTRALTHRLGDQPRGLLLTHFRSPDDGKDLTFPSEPTEVGIIPYRFMGSSTHIELPSLSCWYITTYPASRLCTVKKWLHLGTAPIFTIGNTTYGRLDAPDRDVEEIGTLAAEIHECLEDSPVGCDNITYSS